jgi:DnaJ domain
MPCSALRTGAARDEIREAYVALAKAYHPDRYANVVLPPEVADYMAAMARRINAAHAALEAPEKRRAMRRSPSSPRPAAKLLHQDARPFADPSAALAAGCRQGLAVCSSFCMSSASS